MYMSSVNLAGFVHRDKQMKSQDFIARRNRRGINAMCLCDGAGSYRYTEIGARTLADGMSGYLADQFFNIMNMDETLAKMLIVARIRKCIRDLAARHGCQEKNAYASTMICAAMEARTGRYIAFHLGDGFLAAVNHGEVERLTFPGQYGSGDNSSATVLSTSDAKLMLADIKYVSGKAEGIMMSSDGAEGMIYNRNEVGAMAKTIVDGVRRVGPACADVLLRKAAAAFKAMDDISIGLMLCGIPEPGQIGFCYGLKSHRESMRERRILRAIGEYASGRDNGLNPAVAARRAGWGRHSSSEKRAYCVDRLGVF